MTKRIILILTLFISYLTAFGNGLRYNGFYMASRSFSTNLSEITICEDETLELTAEPIANASYKWLTSDNVSVTNIDLIRTNVTLDMAGEYALTVTVNGCSDTSIIKVKVIPKPNAGIDGVLEIVEGIEPTEEELFNALGGTPEPNGVWTKRNDIYTYTVTSNNSCKNLSVATVTIIESIKIVNGFSPNGDGINDTWKILPDLLAKYPNNQLMVFNRHGNKVYEDSPYKNDWNAITNGKIIINNGKKLPSGPYYYVLELNNLKKSVFKGWVYINY